MVALQQLPAPCSCLAFNEEGEIIAAGAARAPRVYLFAADSLELIHACRLASRRHEGGGGGGVGGGGGGGGGSGGGGSGFGAVSTSSSAAESDAPAALRFSPNSKLLAVCTLRGWVYLFDAVQRFALLGTLPADGAPPLPPLVSLDWHADSERVRVGAAAGGVHCFNACGRVAVPIDADRSSETGDPAAWATSSVVGAIGSSGAVGLGMRTTAIGALARSPEGDIIAAGDCCGRMRLYRFPAYERAAGHRKYSAHGAPVGALAFSYDDRHVVSVARDGCMLLWRHWNEPGERELSDDEEEAEEERAARERHRLTLRLPADDAGILQHNAEGVLAARGMDARGHGRAEARGGLLESMSQFEARRAEPLRALPPWRRALAAQEWGGASETDDVSDVAPPHAVLAWVHGYRGHDCRGNVHFNSEGDAVYAAASLVVVAGAAAEGGKRVQRFFRGHSDDVLCLAAHPQVAQPSHVLTASDAAGGVSLPPYLPLTPSHLRCLALNPMPSPFFGSFSLCLPFFRRSCFPLSHLSFLSLVSLRPRKLLCLHVRCSLTSCVSQTCWVERFVFSLALSRLTYLSPICELAHSLPCRLLYVCISPPPPPF
eukprot:5123045-Pleurochrysis_carterae.AAC.2